MTKKDYELFAHEVFSTSSGQNIDQVKNMVELLSRVFSRDNPLFNSEKFKEACFYGKHIRKTIKA